MTIVDINGNTYDTADLIVDRGYITMFPAMLNDVAAVADQVANTVANAMATSSTTALSLGSGTKTFTTVDNLDSVVAFVDGMWVTAKSVSNPSNYMIGTVTSAAGTTLTTTMSRYNGSGTVSDWTIFATGAPGDGYSPGGTDVAVADGGSGRSSHTAYTPICGGTSSSSAQQSVAAIGTTKQVLKSNGADALPSFENTTSVAAATASFTLDMSAIDTVYKLSHASVAISVTVPPNSSVAFPIGTQIALIRYGAAACSVVAGSGVTIRKIAGAGLSILDQYTMAALVKLDTDEWLLVGNV